MKGSTGRKSFTECLSNFLSDPEGLTQEELDTELEAQSVDLVLLDNRIAEIVKKGSEERRLAWRNRAAEKRAKIEELLNSKELAAVTTHLKDRVMAILQGNYGQEAVSYAQTYFHKKEGVSEKDMESLIEDLEDLKLIEGSDREGK